MHPATGWRYDPPPCSPPPRLEVKTEQLIDVPCVLIERQTRATWHDGPYWRLEDGAALVSPRAVFPLDVTWAHRTPHRRWPVGVGVPADVVARPQARSSSPGSAEGVAADLANEDRRA